MIDNSCKDNDKKCLIHSKGDNIEVMINDEEYEVIEEVFQSLHLRYQNILETSMKGSGFIFDCVNLLYYKWNTIYQGRDGLFKATINPINKKDRCFRYAAKVTLNWEDIFHLRFKMKVKVWVTSCSFYDSEWRKTALSSSKKISAL